MKLTESMLRKIIKQELKKTLKESSDYWPTEEPGGDRTNLNNELLDMLSELASRGKDFVPVEVVAQRLGMSPQQVIADVQAAMEGGEFWIGYPYNAYDGSPEDPSLIALEDPLGF
jgi:hypothetical protein